MTKEEKDLLIGYLYSVLPFGVYVNAEHDWFYNEVPPYDCLITPKDHNILNNFFENPITCSFTIKPYLRTFEQMTEDEHDYHMKLSRDLKVGGNIDLMLNFYLSHHLDYLGLIYKGLALKATDEIEKQYGIKKVGK